MATLIADTFDPDRGPRVTDLVDVPDARLRALALAGSVEAVQELARRRQVGGPDGKVA